MLLLRASYGCRLILGAIVKQDTSTRAPLGTQQAIALGIRQTLVRRSSQALNRDLPDAHRTLIELHRGEHVRSRGMRAGVIVMVVASSGGVKRRRGTMISIVTVMRWASK